MDKGEAQWTISRKGVDRKRHIKTLLILHNEQNTEWQTKIWNRDGECELYKEGSRSCVTLAIFLEIERPALVGNIMKSLYLI